MKRLICLVFTVSCLPALCSPIGNRLSEARLAALEEKVRSLEIRAQNLDNALLDQSIEICSLRKKLAAYSSKD